MLLYHLSTFTCCRDMLMLRDCSEYWAIFYKSIPEYSIFIFIFTTLFFNFLDRRGISMLSLTGEIKSSNGILSMNNSPRRHYSADSSPVRRKKVVTTSALSACEVPDNAARRSYASPSKGVSVTKKPEGKVHSKVEGAEKGNSPQQQQQWCTPLLANNAVLKRMQAEEKIHRRLSEPLGSAAGTATGTGTAVAVSLPGSPSIATKIQIISPSKDSSLRIVPLRENERGRERGRSAERLSRSEQYLRSGSREKSRSAGRSVSPSKAHADHAESDYSFEQEREASYLNKHLGFSSKDELWQDDLIGVCCAVISCIRASTL
jgi:hypothetical protein